MIADLIRSVVPARFRPIRYLENLASARTNGCIPRGPFTGMRYITGSVGSALIPKLLGIYERELNEYVERACSLNFPLIVDIGAAEGYYAIGLARRNSNARIVAFEMETKGQIALKEMAERNNVAERVEIRGKCELEDLQATLADVDHAFVVCDTEGYEDVLLKPDAVPALKRATILVELHDFIIPGITEELKKRFGQSHRIEHVWQQPRSRAEFPYCTLGTMLLPKSYLDWAVSEWRPVRMAWLWMEPK
jgi:hypothetical protein